MDTVIIYDPETFREIITVVPREEGTRVKVTGQLDDEQNLNPLILIDGRVYNGSLKDLDVYDIKEVNVIKGDKSIDKYGDRGQNGVVDIILKEGASYGQVPMDTIITYDPVTYKETIEIVPVEEGSKVKVDGKEFILPVDPDEIVAKDTLIIYDPKTYTETTILRPQLDEDFEMTLRYKDEQVTLTSDHAEWTELTFSLRDGETQIIDYNGLAESRDHEAQFSLEIIKDDNQFTFRNNHGFDWVEMQTNCNKWIYSKTEITKSGVEINCF